MGSDDRRVRPGRCGAAPPPDGGRGLAGLHKVTLAKQILKDYPPDNDLFPSYHIPELQDEAKKRFAKELGELRAAYADRKATETA